MLRQREVVANDRDLIGAARLFHQRRGTGAIGTFQIFKYDDGNAGTARGAQGVLVLRARGDGDEDRQPDQHGEQPQSLFPFRQIPDLETVSYWLLDSALSVKVAAQSC